MPLAFSLFVFLAVFLSGCAPSARTPLAPVEAGQTLPHAGADSAIDSSSTRCFEQHTRGMAEVVAVEAELIRFRFYPGEQLFARARTDYDAFGVRQGDELRSVRVENTGVDCRRLSFRLINDRLLDADPVLVGMNEA